MRQCPTPAGEIAPLITHRIGVAVCLERQAAHYHKCHRCVFRGKPADFEPEARLRIRPQPPLLAADRNGAPEAQEPTPPDRSAAKPEPAAEPPAGKAGGSKRRGGKAHTGT